MVMTDVTRILNAIEGGDQKATDELLPLVYDELRLLAAQKLSHEKPGHTLQATALVHEAYMRLIGSDGQGWDNRGHFFKAAAEAMRRILVDNARRKKRLKRGGDRDRAELKEALIPIEVPNIDLIALDEALVKLEADDPTRANIVKLRYFGGLTLEQTAQVLRISTATANRHWACARSWLFMEISKGGNRSQSMNFFQCISRLAR
jgi:RNA polymerase sigma factor (TIGR02999 family)